MPHRLRRRARGVALLIVLVVLVLIATLATEIAISAKTTYRLADHSMDDLLLRSAVDGRVAILRCALRYDGTNGSGFDGEADEWSWHNREKLSGWGDRATSSFGEVTGDEAHTTAAFKNTDVQLTAWCEDERSKVNLRGLMKPEETPVFQQTHELLVRLIDLYREKHSDLDLTDGDAKEMVDDLVKFLQAEADTEENPMPAVKANRGRLQSVDDLLRVPGGHWTAERLYDVKDEDAYDADGNPIENTEVTAESDPAWDRQNGIPGLSRYITVFAEDTADPQMKVNVNTAPLVVLKALFDASEEDLADKIVSHRREGADDPSTTSGTTGSTSGSTSSTDTAQGFFKNKQDLTKVEGMDQDLGKYPRLNFFADVASPVYSIRVIAKVVRQSGEESDASNEDTGQPKQIEAVYDYREVVQRTNAGFMTLFVERRTDPMYETK